MFHGSSSTEKRIEVGAFDDKLKPDLAIGCQTHCYNRFFQACTLIEYTQQHTRSTEKDGTAAILGKASHGAASA